jgi:hypothetical protein
LVETLFDEYARRYLRGEQPDVRDYLARAGAESEDLARMLDRFLEAAPAREPTEEEVVLMQARLESEPPLLLLRLRRKLSRASVVDALVGALGLDPAKRGKVDGYYHRLETGLLEPGGVNRSVWNALSDFLHANVRTVAGLRPPPSASAAVSYKRLADGLQARMSYDMIVEPAHEAREPEPDEIDRLFTAGP